MSQRAAQTTPRVGHFFPKCVAGRFTRLLLGANQYYFSKAPHQSVSTYVIVYAPSSHCSSTHPRFAQHPDPPSGTPPSFAPLFCLYVHSSTLVSFGCDLCLPIDQGLAPVCDPGSAARGRKPALGCLLKASEAPEAG